MNKKILSMGLIGILTIVLVTLSGCGEKGNNEENKENSQNSLASQVKVGDYVDYKTVANNKYTSTKEKNGGQDATFETTGNEKWRVLSVNDDGTVNIVSDESIHKTTTNDVWLKLYGAKGYANSIDELNAICSIYGNGNCAISARSMTIEDVFNTIGISNLTRYFSIDDTGLSADEIISQIKKESAIKFSDYYNYKEDWEKEYTISNEKLNYEPDKNSDTGYSQKETLKYKENNMHLFKMNQEIINDKKIISTIFGNDWDGYYFYLASTYTGHSSYYGSIEQPAHYGIYVATPDLKDYSESIIETKELFNSGLGEAGGRIAIRPVVTLDAKTKCTEGDGSVSNPYIIK